MSDLKKLKYEEWLAELEKNPSPEPEPITPLALIPEAALAPDPAFAAQQANMFAMAHAPLPPAALQPEESKWPMIALGVGGLLVLLFLCCALTVFVVARNRQTQPPIGSNIPPIPVAAAKEVEPTPTPIEAPAKSESPTPTPAPATHWNLRNLGEPKKFAGDVNFYYVYLMGPCVDQANCPIVVYNTLFDPEGRQRWQTLSWLQSELKTKTNLLETESLVYREGKFAVFSNGEPIDEIVLNYYAYRKSDPNTKFGYDLDGSWKFFRTKK